MPKSAPAFAALQVRTGESSSTVRYLYLKPGVLQTGSADGIGTALFVAGLGVYYEEAVLSELFSVFGSVRQVAVHANKVWSSLDNCRIQQDPEISSDGICLTQTSALLIFKSASSVKKALKTAAEGKSLQFQFSEPTVNFGLKGKNMPNLSGCVHSETLQP